jgi:hypothetical protein
MVLDDPKQAAKILESLKRLKTTSPETKFPILNIFLRFSRVLPCKNRTPPTVSQARKLIYVTITEVKHCHNFGFNILL